MKNDKVLSMLGLSRKAGKVDSGEFAVENAVKSHKAFLVIIAEDASANTEKKFADMCSFRHIEAVRYADKDRLGAAIGCGPRAVVSIRDSGFAASIRKLIGEDKFITGKN